MGQRIAIHASKWMEDLADLAEYIHYYNNGGIKVPIYEAMVEPLAGGGFASLAELPRG